MSDHYFIAADHGHLRIFTERKAPGQSTSTLEEIQALDFPFGKKSYAAEDSDMAGRFQGSKHQAAAAGAPNGGVGRTGMSIDERLPMQREADRRRIRDLVEAIGGFLQSVPEATWDFAAGPSVNNAVLESLAPQVRARLRNTIAKDLVNQPAAELRGHFNLR
jgi:hypothetical protein